MRIQAHTTTEDIVLLDGDYPDRFGPLREADDRLHAERGGQGVEGVWFAGTIKRSGSSAGRHVIEDAKVLVNYAHIVMLKEVRP